MTEFKEGGGGGLKHAHAQCFRLSQSVFLKGLFSLELPYFQLQLKKE